MPNSKQIVYLSQAQYQELITNGSITVDGVTVTYDENDIYVTPQAEPVTDVRVNGTSVSSDGVAEIPRAILPSSGDEPGNFGLVSLRPGRGIAQNTINGSLFIEYAGTRDIKAGADSFKPITPTYQQNSVFFGLSKVAGVDLRNETVTLGTYTPEAKGAIQQMLGVSDLIATAENDLVASKAYAIGDVFTANGKLYKATAAIAEDATIIPEVEGEEIAGANCVETNVGEGFVKFTDYASLTDAGVVKISNNGIGINANKAIQTIPAGSSSIKSGTINYNPIVPLHQHESAFYGLAKAAGDTTQSQSDNAVGTYTDDAKSAIRTMLGAVGTTDYASSTDAGVVKVDNGTFGITMSDTVPGKLMLMPAYQVDIKSATSGYRPITALYNHIATFYGLAKASGDTTQSASSNAVGTYTDNAKASIKSMLGIVDGSTGTVDVTGAAPTITAVENTRYVCGEVTSLTITPAASGICIIRFTSGSTPTLLTLPSTVKFPEWFDATTLETNTIYEICITDGVYGAVMSWAL